MNELEYIKRILSAFSGEAYDLLMWREKPDGTFEFSANVSDVFYWGTADAEDITPENLEVLEEAKADIMAIDSWQMSELAALFAARVRNLRPQGAMSKYYEPEILPLFEALPERERDIFNPKAWPEQ